MVVKLAAVGKSDLVTKRNEIVANDDNLLTAADLDQIETLNKYLSSEPEIMKELIEVLIQTQEKMMGVLGVGGRSIPIAHVREVVDLVRERAPDMPLAALLAAVHDMVKMTSVGEDGTAVDLSLTAEHEVLSAHAAKKVGRELAEFLKETKGWEGIIGQDGSPGGVAKLFSYVLTHGEGEYPETVATETKIVLANGEAVGEMEGGEYVFNPSTREVRLAVDVAVDVSLARRILELVSGADKLVGMSPDSLVKYLAFTPIDKLFSYDGADDLLFDRIYASFRKNYLNSPDSEMKAGFLHSETVHQSILTLLCLKGDYSLEGEEKFNLALLGEDGKKVAGKLGAFKQFFERHRGERTLENKQILVSHFRELVGMIKSVKIGELPNLEKVVSGETERILLGE
jgi:hypothetical protein